MKYITTLEEKINKIKRLETVREQVDLMLSDIKKYLMEGVDAEGNTIQSVIGISLIFRGWIVKNWINVLDNQPRRIHLLNKIIIKQSVLFYAEAWKHRNEVLHHPETYRSYVIEWYNKVVESIENDNRLEMCKYLRAQKLEVENCDSAYIRY